tara:strand:+ start:1573 stop:2298 length:726 start_codon:yes stop_codon:yes gene_type:complete
MINKELDTYIGIISSKRFTNVSQMSQVVGNATWYVGKGEAGHYRAMGAEYVKESGGLCESRNQLLRDAWALDKPCLQLSDDLKGLGKAYICPKKKKKKKKIDFYTSVKYMLHSLEGGAFMAGVAPTSNPFFWQKDKPISEKNFIVGDMILVKPCDLYFDEQLKLKEDYDYTLQHLTKYGKVARVNYLLVDFQHRTNKGGAVAYRMRNKEAEKIAIKYLQDKWGEHIKLNTKRVDEILLRWK